MSGYSRQHAVDIADGEVIEASEINAEFNAVEAAFNSTTGHNHDGTALNGVPITVIGPAQDVEVTASNLVPKTDGALDLGSLSKKFKDIYAGTASLTSLTSGTVTATNLTADSLSVTNLSDPLVFNTVADVLADTKVLADYTSDYGSSGLVYLRTKTGANYTLDLTQTGATTSDVETAGGVKLDVVTENNGVFPASHFGFSALNTGVENSAILLKIIEKIADKGGNITFGDGTFELAPQDYPQTLKAVTLSGIGFRSTIFVPSVFNTGTREWMGKFGAEGTTNSYSFSRIQIESAIPSTRSEFNGFWVRGTNVQRFDDCMGRFVDGTAWRLDRVFNSPRVNFLTFSSGSSVDGLNSVLITSDAVTETVSNDLVLSGTSEADYLGWRVENTAVLRCDHPIKIHGSSNTVMGLELHKVTNGQLDVFLTLDFSGKDFVRITDGTTTTAQVVPSSLAGNNTRLSLKVHNNQNLRYVGTGTGTSAGATVGIYLDVSGSNVSVEGLLQDYNASTGDIVGVYLGTAGNSGADVDLSRLIFPRTVTESERLLDVRTATKKCLGQRAVGIHLPRRSDFPASNVFNYYEGQLDYFRNDGLSGTANTFDALGLNVDNGKNVMFLPLQSIHGNANNVSVETPIIGPSRVTLVSDTNRNSYARIKSVKVGASGLTGSFDAANHWNLNIYSFNTLVDILDLDVTNLSSTAGDGKPNWSTGGWIAFSKAFEYKDGLSATNFFPNNILTAVLSPTGSPPTLDSVWVEINYEVIF